MQGIYDIVTAFLLASEFEIKQDGDSDKTALCSTQARHNQLFDSIHEYIYVYISAHYATTNKTHCMPMTFLDAQSHTHTHSKDTCVCTQHNWCTQLTHTRTHAHIRIYIYIIYIYIYIYICTRTSGVASRFSSQNRGLRPLLRMLWARTCMFYTQTRANISLSCVYIYMRMHVYIYVYTYV